MRLSRLLTFALYAGLASSYGSRAAMERALYFLIYEMEDMFSIDGVGNGDSPKLAAGCPAVGSGERRGLTTSSKRCSLAQFLDWTWRKTPTKIGGVEYFDTKPDLSSVKWPQSEAIMTSSSMKARQIAPYIENAQDGTGQKLTRKVDITKNDGTPGKIQQHGYTGNVAEADRLWANSGHPGGFDGYTRSIEKIADRAKELNDHWQKAIDDGKVDIKGAHEAAHDRITKQLAEAKLAAERVVVLRKVDQMRAIKQSATWRQKLGGNYAVWDVDGDGVAYMKREETRQKMVAAGRTYSEAKELLDNTWKEVEASDKYQTHEAAVKKAEEMNLKMRGIGVAC
ncbi:hypothetical protein RB594_004723 [Gaeumannomyces avenae]